MLKILPILLITCTCLFGQDALSTMPGSMFPEDYQHDDNYYNVNLGDMIIISLLDYYGEYETECYNDSTLQEVIIENNFIYYHCGVLGCAVDHGSPFKTESRWIHKQPTFQGFIEYLRKKLEETDN